MRAWIRTGLIAALAMTLAACAGTPPAGSPEPGGQTVLVVDNRSILQLTVYARRDSQRQRLGLAPPLVTTRLRIPASLVLGVTSLQFEVEPMSSDQAPITEEILVSPGAELRLLIPPTYR
jgi:hypothetical protein